MHTPLAPTRKRPDFHSPHPRPAHSTLPADLDALLRFLADHPRLTVLTGAGCSTESGIPDYRDAEGDWKHRRPMSYREFTGSGAARRRYWARSLVGWERMARALPNAAHRALHELETAGVLHWLVTQNVDGLHRRAGSSRLTELHGRLDRVECLECRIRFPRDRFQSELERLNPGWGHRAAAPAPDGDARLSGVDFDSFRVPPCPACAGVLKPAVVFFGEAVPPRRVRRTLDRIAESDALLVVGSSLMVWSAYRFVRAASRQGIPTAAVNLGRTRADEELAFKVRGRCGEVLPLLARRLLG